MKIEFKVLERNLEPAEGKHRAAEVGSDFRGIFGNALVGALYSHPEQDFPLPLRLDFCGDGGKGGAYLAEILVGKRLHLVGDGKGMYAEHPLQTGKDFEFVLRCEIFDIISALRARKAAVNAL